MPLTSPQLVALFPPWLRERARGFGEPHLPDGEFVLYWLRTAVRADENPALDAALAAGNALGLPVLIYHALSERYPYASDRHHTFQLEAARDLQAAIGERNVGYVFHLERIGHRGGHLKEMALRSALIVTEDMPVEPLRTWTMALGRQTRRPVIAVDTACVAPMQLLGKAYDRAFAFRTATQRRYDARLNRSYLPLSPRHQPLVPDNLPFQPLDLQAADVAELVAQCAIDHAIGPLPETLGGSTAGYARWDRFRQSGLAHYARRRNDALLDGVSRMSPYLHYGMVSPFRIAREAAAEDNEGAKKYLDELLIWRELAYNFCFYRSDHGQTSALPGWALATLQEHARDTRPALPTWEVLARGRTGDDLWDAAQRSLLIHGELHNNVRMTWGKSLLHWTPDARTALATMIDLNHRYALDGQDPASYGGLLWCLGQFDRPFPPPRPIFGTVRDRSTKQHAQRLDPRKYLHKVARSVREPAPRVAVVGAGLAGLFAARTLADHGLRVTVFEKSRGVGGRMATRRTERGLQFDHGAQYFTVRDPHFRRYVDSWQQDGLVHPWRGRIVVLDHGAVTAEKAGTPRYVGVPTMNRICQHLADDLEVRLETQVAPLERRQETWNLSTVDGSSLGEFDAVIVSAPAGQTAQLLRTVPTLAGQAGSTKMHGCWAVMLALEEPLPRDYAGAFVDDSPLAWIARDGRKPGREPAHDTWVLHASSTWTEAHFEDSAPEIIDQLATAFWEATGVAAIPLCPAAAHRWRFALPPEPLADPCLFDAALSVAACGDWCGGPRVEGAFLSGMAAAGRLLGLFCGGWPEDGPAGQRSGADLQSRLF